MPNLVSGICTALAPHYVPTALGACGKAVGFLTDKLVAVYNSNTELAIRENNRDTDNSVENDSFDFSNVVKIATPVIIATLLLVKYIHSGSKSGYNEALLNAHSRGEDAHNPGREDTTFSAIRRLIEIQNPMNSSDVESNIEKFVNYLDQYALKDNAAVIKAKQTLGIIPLPDDEAPLFSFPPLFKCDSLLFGKIPINGKELIAQTWDFIENYIPDDVNHDISLIEREKENCRIGFVNALSRGIEKSPRVEHEHRICSYGICQHIVTGVLQGRLNGVDDDGDGDGPNVAQLLTLFLQRDDIQSITTKAALIEKALTFLSSTDVLTAEQKEVFMRGVEDYSNITYED